MWCLKRLQDECASDAAAREVLEEVGLDISGKIRDDDDEYKFTHRMGDKVTTLFIVDNIPEDTTITKTLSSYEIAVWDDAYFVEYERERGKAFDCRWFACRRYLGSP